MNDHLPPDAWRSEAFAEDLFEDSADHASAAAPLRNTPWSALLGLLPVALATAGAALSTFSHVA